MYGAAIAFLILTAIFGRHVFAVYSMVGFGGILAIIGLFILAQPCPLRVTNPERVIIIHDIRSKRTIMICPKNGYS